MFDASIYKGRRDELRKSVGKGKILLFGNNMSPINFAANCYPFRQDSTFLYYFGIQSPRTIGVIDCDENRDILYRDDADIDTVVWTGPQVSIADLAQQCGVDNTAAYNRIFTDISSLRSNDNESFIHYLPPYRPEHTLLLAQLLSKVHKEVATGASERLIRSVVAQRSIKSVEEIEEMDGAARLSADMHAYIMQIAKEGMYEYELVARAEQFIKERGGRFSYAPILTNQGQILHNEHYHHRIQEGDMILFDGGTETEMGYAADLTRTFPVNTTFTTRQRTLYDIVHQSYVRAVEACRPGVRFIDIHLLAAKTLVEGLIDVGLMKGNAQEAVMAGAHTLFFQCGLGHMIGLDVHDMENLGEPFVGYTDRLKQSDQFGLKSLRLGRELEEGFTVTVEPGIYMIPTLMDMFAAERKFDSFINYSELAHYRDFGGIRIEDDFVISSTGSRILGKQLAVTSDEIEQIRMTK